MKTSHELRDDIGRYPGMSLQKEMRPLERYDFDLWLDLLNDAEGPGVDEAIVFRLKVEDGHRDLTELRQVITFQYGLQSRCQHV
jgi:hypothetical protein